MLIADMLLDLKATADSTCRMTDHRDSKAFWIQALSFMTSEVLLSIAQTAGHVRTPGQAGCIDLADPSDDPPK